MGLLHKCVSACLQEDASVVLQLVFFVCQQKLYHQITCQTRDYRSSGGILSQRIKRCKKGWERCSSRATSASDLRTLKMLILVILFSGFSVWDFLLEHCLHRL